MKVREVVERLTTGMAPVPLRLTVCGLPLALSAMLNWPVTGPGAVGLKVTLKVQLAPAATLEPQLLVSAKPGLMDTFEMVSAPSPRLDSLTVCAAPVVPWFPNIRLAGERLTTGAVPMPVRGTDCGLSRALSVMVIEP